MPPVRLTGTVWPCLASGQDPQIPLGWKGWDFLDAPIVSISYPRCVQLMKWSDQHWPLNSHGPGWHGGCRNAHLRSPMSPSRMSWKRTSYHRTAARPGAMACECGGGGLFVADCLYMYYYAGCTQLGVHRVTLPLRDLQQYKCEYDVTMIMSFHLEIFPLTWSDTERSNQGQIYSYAVSWKRCIRNPWFTNDFQQIPKSHRLYV